MDMSILRQVAEDFIPFNKFLGVKAPACEVGRVVLEVPFREELVGDAMRPAIHGGVISMLADAAGGMAVWSELEGFNARVSTIDLRIDYLRPARLEALCAEGTTVRVGKSVGVADIRVYHPNNRAETIATGKGVYSIKRAREATKP